MLVKDLVPYMYNEISLYIKNTHGNFNTLFEGNTNDIPEELLDKEIYSIASVNNKIDIGLI